MHTPLHTARIAHNTVVTAALSAIFSLALHGQTSATLVDTITLDPTATTSALTSIAVDPGINTIYVADGTSTNVYLVDGSTNTVTASVLTSPFVTSATVGVDGTPLGPGYAPNVVLANPITHRWAWMGQSQGVKFNGTVFDEFISAKAMRLGGAWDPITDNMYFADALRFWAINNLKLLGIGYPAGGSNAVAVNPMTGRVYVSGSLGGLTVFDGAGFQGVNNPAPLPIAFVNLGLQPSGLAINPNTNRVYAAMILGGVPSLAVIDGTSHQLLASIPGLSGPMALPPNPFYNFDYLDLRAVSIAIDTLMNEIFVVNPATSTVSVFDGNTNTLIDTLTTPDGAVAAAVNEQTSTLYVANSAGTVSVFALTPTGATPTFSINGVVKDTAGTAQIGATVKATGAGGTVTVASDSVGAFALTGLPSGAYTVTASSPSFSFAPQSVTIANANVRGIVVLAMPPIVPVAYALSPWTLVGPGVTTAGTITLNQPAPSGGLSVALSTNDAKPAKFPETVTIPAGATAGSFIVQGNGVSATTTVTLSASANGGSASATLTVAPSDSLKVTKAAWSRSTQLLTVTGTSTNGIATLQVQNANNNAILGTMTYLGSGSYSYQQTIATGVPTSVSLISNLGGKTGQGVAVVP